MKTVAIISKPSKPELGEIVRQLVVWLCERQYTVLMDEETAVYGSNENVVPRKQIADRRPDFVIVLGGDGTLLAAARAVSRAGTPILAVNLGSLGFLTEVPLGELYSTLEALELGHCHVHERAVLECDLIRNGKAIDSYFALNEAVVNKSAIARLVAFDVRINGEYVYTTKADGVIISTPTGSTAYSLAAGGPVLMPQVDAFVITPVCPHSFTQRPLVVRDDATIEVIIESGGEKGFLSIDGQVGEPLEHGDRLVCRRAAHKVRLLRMRRTFFEVLRNKLKWGQR
ncbi:MAG TPA: NAD(+)/NADH kinase [Clostridia bacterium]|nr:NAD(+)/NADH kinase [Clostridia bacterium]